MSTSRRPIGEARGAALVILVAGVAALVTLSALTIGCETSDPTAPEGSTITMSANPQTVLPGQSSSIIATLRSSNGTRLPDQEIVFSTTVGLLNPPAQTAILTDDDGEAVTLLTTPSSATVTASSGTISATTSVTVSGCALSAITLNLSSQVIPTCSTSVTLTVNAVDTNSDPCEDLIVRISSLAPISGLTRLVGSIALSQGLTNASGDFITTFTPDQTSCQSKCDTAFDPNAPNNGNCEVDFVAEDVSGSIESFRETLGESVP